ncbi:hypothetical protein [Hymenobacter profundi]|uniref:DUF3823 domain-containing protein n=1 Tax=Hymenobacter profundi TaxID=1982110 RepID=A0ABS6X5Q8_9BACT|nr:hypothetical protein [Hymenobacter profundi]MBW3131182.1 hypothetical protein [Hymenobacter profundi]
MLTIRTLVLGASFLLAGAGVSSCLTAPDYPDTPSIEFENIRSERVVADIGNYDTVTVTVSFRDGDGDLGLDNSETNAPYNLNDASGQPNKFYNNYFFQPQILRDGTFVDFNFTGSFRYDSRFPRIPPIDRNEPKRGNLSFGLQIFQGTFPAGSQVRFKVSIADRALNVSNEVITDPITIQ